MSKHHIIIAKLFGFGGSNTHLKTLIKYLGNDNVILLLEGDEQLKYLDKIGGPETIRAKVFTGIHHYAHLEHASKLSNIKEVFVIFRSLVRVLFFCLRNNAWRITISTVEPEKYLYLFWIPFVRICYVVHSTPQPRFTSFTSMTCNTCLANRKHIITVSKANKRAICEAWRIKDMKTEFVSIIYNCVAEDKAENESYSVLSEPLKNIITMGHVVSYKNPWVWIKVAKRITERHKDVQFTWLGNGALLEEMRKEAEGSNICFAGLMEDPSPYLRKAIVYYQPSQHETHGIAVLEAMSYQLPCVVSDIGGLPESVENNVNGILVPPNDVDQHVAAIEKLIADPALRQMYGRNGYKKCKEHFSFEKFKFEMDKIYFGS